MQIIDSLLAKVNAYQRQHPIVGFPLAVIKKFGDDNGGYQAALLTYYGFLSLFPILLILITVLHTVFANNPDVQASILANINTYFPLLGEQLTDSIGGIGKTGFGLLVGILILIYGARGGADALRYTLDSMWNVPKEQRAGFPKNIFKSLAVMAIGGVGFLLSATASAIASGFGRVWWLKLVIPIVGVTILSVIIATVFHIGSSRRHAIKTILPGAIVSAVSIQLLLLFGSILVANQLKNLDSLYGTFAIVLGLLFWLYLLAQVLVYSVEINTVRAGNLWPRSLQADKPFAADKQAAKLSRP